MIRLEIPNVRKVTHRVSKSEHGGPLCWWCWWGTVLGHAASWCKGYPEVCPSPQCTQPLNPASASTFELIEALLGECTGKVAGAGLFPEKLIHLGGDEVDTSCWSSTPSVAAWLKAQNMSANDGYEYFVKRAAAVAIAQGRRPIQWNEVFLHFGTDLPKESIVHSWSVRSVMGTATAAGYNALNSQGHTYPVLLSFPTQKVLHRLVLPFDNAAYR